MYVPHSEGVVTSSNVTLNDEMSGVLGLGFPRISNIFQHTVNGESSYPFRGSDYIP